MSDSKLLNPQRIIEYVKEKSGYFSKEDQLHSEEIGDGNINYVFRVSNSSGKTLILKQADVLLRSSQRPLDRSRIKMEATAMEIHGKLVPQLIPKIYNFDEVNGILLMEDIAPHVNLRQGLMAGGKYPQIPGAISDFVAKGLLGTTDLLMEPREKQELTGFFVNRDMRDISETLVFTEPYHNNRERNVITPGNEAFVQQRLYKNIPLQREAALLKYDFMNEAQSLLHGDLHTGSVFVTADSLKILDAEFAFYGPMAYDLGSFLGNLILSLGHHVAKSSCSWQEALSLDYPEGLLETLRATWDETADKLKTGLQTTRDLMGQNPDFQQGYLARILSQSAGFAGMEIIRRVVGDAGTADMDSLPENDMRIQTERQLILLGERLIMNRGKISTGNRLKEVIKGEQYDG